MYFPVVLFFLLAGISWFVIYKIRSIKAHSAQKRSYAPVEGADAFDIAIITTVTNSSFSVSKYLRNVKNTSTDQFITVAIRQTIRSNMGTTQKIRLIERLAPGEERRLGHADNVSEGKYQIFIGYDILWARCIPAPRNYARRALVPKPAATTSAHALKYYHPALLNEIARQYRDDIV